MIYTKYNRYSSLLMLLLDIIGNWRKTKIHSIRALFDGRFTDRQ